MNPDYQSGYYPIQNVKTDISNLIDTIDYPGIDHLIADIKDIGNKGDDDKPYFYFRAIFKNKPYNGIIVRHKDFNTFMSQFNVYVRSPRFIQVELVDKPPFQCTWRSKQGIVEWTRIINRKLKAELTSK